MEKRKPASSKRRERKLVAQEAPSPVAREVVAEARPPRQEAKPASNKPRKRKPVAQEVPSPVVTEVVAEAEATREESSPASPLILVASRPPRGRPPAAPTQSLIQGLSLALIGFGLLLIFSAGPSPAWQTMILPAGLGGAHEPGDGTISLPLAQLYIPPPPVPGAPATLRIPALGLNSPIMTVGILKGAIDTPCDPDYPLRYCNTNAVAWYNGSVLPGASGDAILDSHDLWYGARKPYYIPAAFTHLYESKVGDQIIVTDAKGQVWVFIIDDIRLLNYDQVLSDTYNTSGPATVTLMTCGGVYNPSIHQMQNRLFVHATLASMGMPARLDAARPLIPFKQPWA